jgi:hypothetical protein
MAYFMASGIRFNDCLFNEPARLADCPLPRCAGLYVILAEDRAWAPKPFQPLYFGEFGNNAPPAALAHEAAALVAACPGKTFYLSVLPLPYSTTRQRWALCRELVAAYNPPSQLAATRTPPADLVLQLDDLERKQQEQMAQLMFLRSHADRFFGPPAERRRIGFAPDTTPAIAVP